MIEKEKAAGAAHQREYKDSEFVSQYKIIYQCFKERPKTTLEAMIETGILRNCITWHVAEMEKQGLIQVVREGLDPHTKVKAGFYSTDEALFNKSNVSQLNLFDDGRI